MKTLSFLFAVPALAILAVFSGCSDDDPSGNDPAAHVVSTNTVAYNDNGATGGSVPVGPRDYTNGQLVSVAGNTSNLIKTGHYLAGWTNGSGDIYSFGSTFTMGTNDVLLYACWDTYKTVIYNANGATSGSAPTDSTDYTNGESVTVTGNTGTLLKYGYYFEGWTNAAGSVYNSGESFPIHASNVALYARWTEPSRTTYSAGPISFTMTSIPGGYTFHTGLNDGDGDQTVNGAFAMAQTEVTYELWTNVYIWATGNGYSFVRNGQLGNSGTGDPTQPVTSISWRDAIVWCNALTEYYNVNNGPETDLSIVYTNGSGQTITNANNGTECDAVVPAAGATGFRLPTFNEWELAARFISDDGDKSLTTTGEYYPGEFASGADIKYDQNPSSDFDGNGVVNHLTNVAWYDANCSSTQIVKGKHPNPLGLYDMNGNVFEWSFTASGANRLLRGGAYSTPVGSWLSVSSSLDFATPDMFGMTIGFRVVRSE